MSYELSCMTAVYLHMQPTLAPILPSTYHPPTGSSIRRLRNDGPAFCQTPEASGPAVRDERRARAPCQAVP
eukprot:6902671-Prymnesium_polylepis.1